MTAHPGPRFLYMHGFASGPASTKAIALADHFAAREIEIERLDGRLPSFEHWRLSATIAAIRGAIGSDRDRAVVFGSSLGGLAAARAAEDDPRICALILLAPAFRFADRWPARLGADEFAAWRDTGWLEVHDHARGAPGRVDFDFYRDAAAVDSRSGGWPDVRVPTLIVHGARDDVVEPEVSRMWATGKRHVHRIETDDDHTLGASIPLICAESERFLAGFLADPS